MTMPALAQPLALGQAANTPADVSARIDTLNASGHQWMPPDLQGHLAASDSSNNDMVSIADSIKTSVQNAWNGFSEPFDDSVLHKQPSGALALARYLHASLGPLPIAEQDLPTIQQNLQKLGYGKDLTPDGVWGADWNTAYNAYSSDLKAGQLSGDRPGSVSVHHAGHSIFDALLPSHAINAVAGFAKGFAHGVNTALGDIVGDVVDIPHLLTGHTDQSDAANQTRAWFQNLGGGNLTAQDIAQQDPISRTTQDLLTMISLVPVAGEGSAAARVVQGAWEGGVDRALAQRTTGVVAKSLFGGRTQTMITDDAARRGVLNAKLFTNIPLLRQVGPVVGQLADADGLYYKTRTLLASPYALPQVRVAGALGQRYMLAGAGLGVAADIAPHLGVNDQLTQDIHNTNVIDTIDLNLGRIIGSPGSHDFSRAINALGFVLHGPLGATAASTAVGDHVQTMVDNLSDLYGNVGVLGAWERGIHNATGQKTSVEDLISAFGAPERLDRFITMKTADLAAAHYAQKTAQEEGLTLGSLDYRDRTGQLADQVWNSPDLHTQAVKELLADRENLALENRVGADAVSSSPKAYGRDGLAWMNAGDHLTDIIRSGLASHMFGADGKTVIANAQDAFDHGLGMDTPVRLLTTTRRDYVNQVTTLLTRVRRGVNDARTTIGREVTAAEASGDTNAISNARTLQTKLEQSLANDDLKSFVEMTKKFSVKKTRGEWNALLKDSARLRGLVDQANPAGLGDRLTLQHLIDHGVNPDELYTNINGEPRPVPADIGSGQWIRDNMQHKNGALGLARYSRTDPTLETKTAQQASADLGRFQARLNAATPDQIDAITEEMRAYGFHEFGLDHRMIGAFTGQQLLTRLQEQADRLASEVYLSWDAPQELKDTIERIKDLGYKPVLGSHIGHMWDGSLPSMPEIDGAITYRRRIAEAMGLGPEQVTSRAAGQHASIAVLREVGKAFRDPNFRAPAYTTPETVIAVLREEGLLQADMSPLERALLNLPTHKTAIRQYGIEHDITDMKQARLEYESSMARSLRLQPRDVKRGAFIKTLTTPGEYANGAEWSGMDKQSANLVRRAVFRAYAHRPGYIQGLSSLEDWARGGFGIGDKLAVKYSADNPLGELAQRAAELPNNLVLLRNRLRFTLSPFFDFRRIAKQNVKMGIDGVTPTLNPLKYMMDQGTASNAEKFLSKLIGEPRYEGFDTADQYLHQQSVWGMYNSRHYEAYYAWEKHLEGATDDEIRQGIRRVFEYGSARTGGRSALERTVNTIFFPFSFEKTLLRNVGAYMIDHPQQALLATGAITAYDEANSNQQIHQWLQDHLPILHDMQKLNAFAHGISPGEFGGINAPLLNLFLPQQWAGGLTKKNLQRFLPIFTDFGQVFHDSREQAVIARNAAENAASYAIHLGAPRKPFDPYRPTITPEAQTRDAIATRNSAIIAWTPVLDYNLHQSSDATKYTFPNDPQLPTSVRGKVVNRTNIGYLVKIWYPAYDPGEARRYAEQQQAKAQAYVDNITDPAKHRDYGVFLKLSNEVQGHLQRGDYDTTTAVNVMSQFRAAAIAASETDPTFYKAYNTYWRWLFGPLEAVTAS